MTTFYNGQVVTADDLNALARKDDLTSFPTQTQVTNELASYAALGDLISTAPGQGASLVGTESGATVQEFIDSLGTPVSLYPYLTAEQRNVTVDASGTVTAGADCTAEFTRAMHDAQNAGKLLDISGLSLLLSGATIVPLSKSGGLVSLGERGTIYCKNWTAKSQSSIQGVNAYAQFAWNTDPVAGDMSSDWVEKNVYWVNLDTSVLTHIWYGNSTMRDLYQSDVLAEGFTTYASFGWYTTQAGGTNNADTDYTALAGMRSGVTQNVRAYTDSNDSSGRARLLAIHGFEDYQMTDCVMSAPNAKGYGVRFVGSESVNNVPQFGKSGSSLSINGYKCVVKADGFWYNQLAKITQFSITNVQARSTGFLAHNTWDIFDCFGGTITNNIVVGSGLAFFGHADKGSGSYPSDLIGARGLTASNNVIINCEHDSVFNLGGDGTIQGPRQGMSSLLSGNVVFDMPGFQAELKQKYLDAGKTAADYDALNRYFVYGFIHEGCDIKGNNVRDLEGFLTSYYVRDFIIDGNTIVPPSQTSKPCILWNTTGSDASTTPFVGQNALLDSTTAAGAGTFDSSQLFYGRAHDLYANFQRKDEPRIAVQGAIGFAAGSSVTLAPPDGYAAYLITVQYSPYSGSTYVEQHLVSRSANAIADVVTGTSESSGTPRFSISYAAASGSTPAQFTVKDTGTSSIGWGAYLMVLG